jgi:hypothetical protein
MQILSGFVELSSSEETEAFLFSPIILISYIIEQNVYLLLLSRTCAVYWGAVKSVECLFCRMRGIEKLFGMKFIGNRVCVSGINAVE